jgi:hypothetical protein
VPIGLSAGKRGAIEEMLGTVEGAMSQVINSWGDLPPPMKEAIEQFHTQVGATIDSMEFVKRAHRQDVDMVSRADGEVGDLGRL